MSDDFVMVTKYECKYCHKLFATTKHDCKWNPRKKNCLSCKHCIGFQQGVGSKYDSDTLGFVDYDSPYFLCDKDMSDFAELDVIYQNHWQGYCEGYEQAECDNYRKRYVKNIVRQRTEEANNVKHEYDLWRGMVF